MNWKVDCTIGYCTVESWGTLIRLLWLLEGFEMNLAMLEPLASL